MDASAKLALFSRKSPKNVQSKQKLLFFALIKSGTHGCLCGVEEAAGADAADQVELPQKKHPEDHNQGRPACAGCNEPVEQHERNPAKPYSQIQAESFVKMEEDHTQSLDERLERRRKGIFVIL